MESCKKLKKARKLRKKPLVLNSKDYYLLLQEKTKIRFINKILRKMKVKGVIEH
jgi:hypothetical protein